MRETSIPLDNVAMLDRVFKVFRSMAPVQLDAIALLVQAFGMHERQKNKLPQCFFYVLYVLEMDCRPRIAARQRIGCIHVARIAECVARKLIHQKNQAETAIRVAYQEIDRARGWEKGSQ